MSGGYFTYNKFTLLDLAEEIKTLIDTNKKPDECNYARNYPFEVLEHFKEAYNLLNKAQLLVHRIDYLIECDDDIESFLEQIEEEKLKIELYD